MQASDYNDWFNKNREELSQRGYWLAGNEPGRPDAAGFASARLRILFCRLSTYRDVLPSITHRLLYQVACQVPGVFADMAYFPPAKDLERMNRDQVPLWLATATKAPPRAFDVLAISLSAQQEALNLPRALRDSGLALSAEERAADPAQPLIVLGGHAAAAAPFLHGPLDATGTKNGLVDVVCCGDGVSWLAEFLAMAMACGVKADKAALLARLARELPGTYVPGFYRQTSGGMTPCQADLPMPVTYRVDATDALLKHYDGAFIPFSDEDTEETLPLSLGCAYRCRFCQTGWARRQLSVADAGALESAALRLKGRMACADLNLLSSDACSVQSLIPLVRSLRRRFPRVSLKSLSLASLQDGAGVSALLALTGKREFTFGVEGISARLRAYLGKAATRAQLLAVLDALRQAGLRQAKLFFILTGLEQDADCEEFAATLAQLCRTHPPLRLIASFTPLFLAPFTPLQFAAAREIPAGLLQNLERICHHTGVEFRLSCSPEEIRLMNLLCRAGRAATPVLAALSLQEQVVYYHAVPPAAVQLAAAYLSKWGLAPGKLLADKTRAEALPWDDIQAGESRAVLWKSYAAALAAPPEMTAPARRFTRDEQAPPDNRMPSHGTIGACWIWVEAEQAAHPQATLARGFWARQFAQHHALMQAYLGHPGLAGFPSAAGLALLHGEFAGMEFVMLPENTGSGPPASRPALFRLDLQIAAGWVFAVETAMAFDVFEKLLKQGRIHHQLRRVDGVRWLLVNPEYRRRTGLWAVREELSGVVFFATQAWSGRHPAGPMTCLAVYAAGAKGRPPRELAAAKQNLLPPAAIW